MPHDHARAAYVPAAEYSISAALGNPVRQHSGPGQESVRRDVPSTLGVEASVHDHESVLPRCGPYS